MRKIERHETKKRARQAERRRIAAHGTPGEQHLRGEAVRVRLTREEEALVEARMVMHSATPATLPARLSLVWVDIPVDAERDSLPGHLCEQCLDAPAVHLQPAPWGGERGVCAACAIQGKKA